jgi:hypothetical protein
LDSTIDRGEGGSNWCKWSPATSFDTTDSITDRTTYRAIDRGEVDGSANGLGSVITVATGHRLQCRKQNKLRSKEQAMHCLNIFHLKYRGYLHRYLNVAFCCAFVVMLFCLFFIYFCGCLVCLFWGFFMVLAFFVWCFRWYSCHEQDRQADEAREEQKEANEQEQEPEQEQQDEEENEQDVQEPEQVQKQADERGTSKKRTRLESAARLAHESARKLRRR